MLSSTHRPIPLHCSLLLLPLMTPAPDSSPWILISTSIPTTWAGIGPHATESSGGVSSGIHQMHSPLRPSDSTVWYCTYNTGVMVQELIPLPAAQFGDFTTPPTRPRPRTFGFPWYCTCRHALRNHCPVSFSGPVPFILSPANDRC
jgi:hypothetical protein